VAAVVSTSSGGRRSSFRLGVGTGGMAARLGPGAALSGSLHRSLGLDAAILGDLVRPLSGPPLRVALQRSIRLARQVGCVFLGGPPVATAAARLADRRLLSLSGRGLGIGGAAGGQRILPWARLLRTAPPDSVGAGPQARLFRIEGCSSARRFCARRLVVLLAERWTAGARVALDQGASSCRRVADATGVPTSTPTSRSTRTRRTEGPWFRAAEQRTRGPAAFAPRAL